CPVDEVKKTARGVWRKRFPAIYPSLFKDLQRARKNPALIRERCRGIRTTRYGIRRYFTSF
ncbi:MAG TPA: hypothetical protein DE315_04505, partial [Candidatus Omnitrophica bacterium]|nr:hypothetical protein [Candidatus Omnitrophota bacterium]